MDANLNSNESLLARIQQLEHERDELHKDIEQLCMQQAGPSYLMVATKMHFQRTAGLEQEIENLKKKLSACTRENINLQEELSEAYRIKSQLADLHHAEVTKNMEAEKQVKFFQGCVASAFAERDHSIMEAEKAKEKEELMSQKFNEIEKRLEELTSDCLEQKRLNDALQSDLAKQKELNETFKKVVKKFYEIRQHSLKGFEDASWGDKCTLLLQDSAEMWSFNDASTSQYISALEEELEKVRKSVDNLRSKLRVGLEIENHLKKRVYELEKQQEAKHGQLDTVIDKEGNSSEALAQAMQEKVAALLLLSQQEERHLLERNVNAALQTKLEELQRNLLQVTNEKVKALMDLAQLKQQYQQLQETVGQRIEGNMLIDSGEKRLFAHEKDGRLRNLLKRTYLRRWIGTVEGGHEEITNLNSERNFSSRRSNSIDFARMKIENATFKEIIDSIEHLTTTIHRLRISLLKVKESVGCESALGSGEALGDIISETKLLKTALSSTLPVSWSAEADDSLIGESNHNDPGDFRGDSSSDKVDPVSAAGLEMVELLILAAQMLKDNSTREDFRDES
ncbi:meiosis-specific nuclear structural protein 1 isoform X3 [Jatropha curcas]|uniref:meiosis-specific nuclear structural protein 1 isoform X3 n=1 Tax=Jatropha curcas TaxID=180498 RepID=UPI0005FBFB14|nr:meiosis-specific nuclear structural protein 1 isoform X3 [Jatropha curcas]